MLEVETTEITVTAKTTLEEIRSAAIKTAVTVIVTIALKELAGLLKRRMVAKLTAEKTPTVIDTTATETET